MEKIEVPKSFKKLYHVEFYQYLVKIVSMLDKLMEDVEELKAAKSSKVMPKAKPAKSSK